jgi:hypothetical protein
VKNYVLSAHRLSSKVLPAHSLFTPKQSLVSSYGNSLPQASLKMVPTIWDNGKWYYKCYYFTTLTKRMRLHN